ncbi:MAG: surface lipoprotein assembly modifier [Luminiphilus sp.]|jgi:hypothetical protein|nr:surface lipoprotein assembly modifier [Luminiphilus sp.]
MLSLQTAAAEWGLDLAVGYSWDDNVGLDELERATGESDEVTMLEAQGSAEFSLGEETSVRLSASLIDDSYQNFSQVDRSTASIGANFETTVGQTTIGINWFDVSADLDDEHFLSYERISPYVAAFLSKQWFMRGEYVYGEKEIEKRPGREANSHTISVDSYYFLQGLKRYTVVGYSFRIDNARANRYDYESHAIRARYVHRETLSGLPIELEFEARWEDRQYKAPDPFIQVEREDTRLRVSAEIRISTTQHTSFALHIKNADYDSNLPTASYSDLVVGTEFRLSF